VLNRFIGKRTPRELSTSEKRCAIMHISLCVREKQSEPATIVNNRQFLINVGV